MIIFTLIAFIAAFILIAFSFYYGIKCYSYLKPEKENLIKFIPFVVFMKSSYLDAGHQYFSKFYICFFTAAIFLVFVIINYPT